MLRKLALAVGVLVCVIGSSLRAEATPYLIGGINYGEVGATETMTASFLGPDGGISTGTYSEFVKVTVSGIGQSLGACFNDAFYVIDCGGPFHDAQYYQLSYDSSTLVGFNPSRDAVNFIVFDIDANVAVTPAYVPAYRPDHIYTFVLNTGLVAPGALHFGTSNGNFLDNSGEHTIQITQLQAVPEPASLLLFGTGVTALARRRLRRRG